MNALDCFRRMQDYEVWANDLALTSIEGCERGLLSQASRIGAAPAVVHEKYARALAIMSHILWARRRWLSRLGACEAPPTGMPAEEWPVTRLRGECLELDGHWQRYLSGLKQADLAKVVRYQSGDGRPQADSVSDIITQAQNHSTYHRGQIATLVKQCGGEPAETDFIVFARQAGAASKR